MDSEFHKESERRRPAPTEDLTVYWQVWGNGKNTQSKHLSPGEESDMQGATKTPVDTYEKFVP